METEDLKPLVLRNERDLLVSLSAEVSRLALEVGKVHRRLTECFYSGGSPSPDVEYGRRRIVEIQAELSQLATTLVDKAKVIDKKFCGEL